MAWIIEHIGNHGMKTTEANYLRMSTPKPGDVVDFGENFKENKYPLNLERKARVVSSSFIEKDEIMICFRASVFLLDNGETDVSGGPFETLKIKDLEFAHDLELVRFWNWGDHRPGAGQGVDYYIQRPVFPYNPK